MADDDSVVGRSLADRYTVTKRIGSGGMSTVYEALDSQLGRRVAIKVFSAGEARDDGRRRSEVDVLARLNHPNLVTMYDAHLTSADATEPSFVVMELVNGPDLRSTLDHGPLRGPVAAQVATDIAEALAAMHAAGIVHRDLKPANILLAPTGLPSPKYRAKLTDFGIAHLVGADRMTTAGTIIGTASYLSPEQAQGAAPGAAADVYALGLVVLESLTGHREYPGTVVEAVSARASRDPVIGDDLPPRWAALLTQMTARSADARPSALEVAERSRELAPELAAWDGPTPAAGSDLPTVAMLAPTRRLPEPPGVPPADARRRGPRAAVLIGVAVILLAGAVWAGSALLPHEDTSGSNIPVPVTTSTESNSPGTDQGGSSGVEPVSTAQPTTESTAPADSPSATPEPVTTSSPEAPAPAPSTSTSTSGTGNNGNGNGNGNGGTGNNGNGNGGAGNNGNGNSGNGNG